MPAARLHRRPGQGARTAGALAIAALALCAGGCASTTGDFGRRSDNIVTNSILPNAGWLGALWRYEPASSFPFTDDEEELRDRAWRLVRPPHDRDWFRRQLAELRYTRVLPLDVDRTPSAYHDALVTIPVRSVASRYERLRDDVEADRLLLGPFIAVAKRVSGGDRVREKAVAAARQVSDAERDDALARIAENRALVRWVCDSIGARTRAYRYALEHLVIEGPQKEAVQAERAVIALETDPRALCQETVPLIDPPPRTPFRGLDRPAIYTTAPPRPVPIEQPLPPLPLAPPAGAAPYGPQGPIVTKG